MHRKVSSKVQKRILPSYIKRSDYIKLWLVDLFTQPKLILLKYTDPAECHRVLQARQKAYTEYLHEPWIKRHAFGLCWLIGLLLIVIFMSTAAAHLPYWLQLGSIVIAVIYWIWFRIHFDYWWPNAR